MTDKERELYNAANAYAFDLDEGDLNTNRDTFIAGAEWQKEQMSKCFFESKVALWDGMKVIEPDLDGITQALSSFNDGDKVKVLIIKEE